MSPTAAAPIAPRIAAVSPQPEAELVGQAADAAEAADDSPARQRSGSLGLPRTATQLAGFQHVSEAPVSREELIEQGVPTAQANARVVRQHEEEVLMEHFRCWILLFSVILCIATPAMVGLFIWLIAANLKDWKVECQMPLQTWVRVTFGIVFYNLTVNRPTPRGSCVQRVFCRWSRDPDNPQPMPLRVWMYNLVFMLFSFVWNCLGLYWIGADGQQTSSEHAVCQDAVPALYLAIKVYASFSIAVTLFMYINMLGFAQLLRVALHRGLLHTTSAAPSGSLECNTEVVTIEDPGIEASPSCSICLEDFEAATPMVKTRACKHLFHKQCLKGWLQVNRTCPLCREDLGKVQMAWQ